MYHWCKHFRQASSLKPLIQIQSKCLSWILNDRQHKISSAICGIPQIPQRHLNLACTFTNHLNSLSSSNPSTILWTKYNLTRPLPKNLLLPRIYHYDPNQDLPLPSNENQDTSQASRLQLSNLQHYQSLGILASYILPNGRNINKNSNNIGPDQSLFFNKFPNYLLQWRLNTFGSRSTCPKCSRPFRRSHVEDCSLTESLTNLSNTYFQELSIDILLYPTLSSSNYNIIDSLLNNDHQDLAYDILKHIKSLLIT